MGPRSRLRGVLGAFLAVLALSGSAAPAQIAPGFRLMDLWSANDVQLVDRNGAVVQTWTSSYVATGGTRLLPDGTLLRVIVTPPLPPGGGACGGVQRLGLDSTVLWDYRYATTTVWSHHDIEAMPNGNVLITAWENKTLADAIAAGRNPALISGSVMRPDHVIEVQPTGPTSGTIVWEWHVWDHLIQDFDSLKANYGVVGQHPELVDVNFPAVASQAADWNHVNALHYDAVHDWLVINTPNQSEVWVVDHSTTSAQASGHSGGARGHGGDLLYRWGNPQAYRAGTSANQQLFGQHGTNIIRPGLPGAGNFLVYNNNAPGGSRAVEFTPPLDANGNFILAPGAAYGPAAPVWQYPLGLVSNVQGSARRLPNGNTLIDSSVPSWVTEVTPGGQQVWNYNYTNRIYQSFYVEETLWGSTQSVSSAAGGNVSFGIIAGSPYAGATYFLLASASGTAPGTQAGSLVLPLNWDPVFQYTLDHPNVAPLSQSWGTLDASGRATASLTLLPGQIGPTYADFAYAVYTPSPFAVLLTSNSVGLTIVP